TLLVAGGLYGNPQAADAIARRAATEPEGTLVVFNGDVHYLDADPGAFSQIMETMASHRCTMGNVEYAIGSGDEAVGCGCAYPPYTPDQVVEHSNAVVERLRVTARDHPDHLEELRALP